MPLEIKKIIEKYVLFVAPFPFGQMQKFVDLQTKPLLWSEYFPGFIGGYASNVVESLYSEDKAL